MEKNIVNIIGAGLAGSECAYILAKNGFKVNLYEMKPNKKTMAHTSDFFSELVCSNSLKSMSLTNACGLLKEEMRILGSLIVEAANATKVPAGAALAVNRDEFAKYVTEKLKENKNINIINEEVENLNKLEGITVIATGPLTSDKLSENLKNLIGEESLYFYDAAAPIVEADSVDRNIAYSMDRYGEGEGDYLNLPMNKQEYMDFYEELKNAESAPRHEFDKLILFSDCMPIEELAKKGDKTLTFGPLKPVGLDNPNTHERNYAVVQLRAENKEKTLYNLVGFQTSLKFKEQDRVFKMIPGLANANFVRYGVMHKNTYINASKLLNNKFQLKNNKNIYFAGQISGVEGYVESAASGQMVAYNIILSNLNKDIPFPEETIMGSLSKHVSTENKNYQPMNANFGILKPLEEKIRDKKQKYEKLSEKAIDAINKFKIDIGY